MKPDKGKILHRSISVDMTPGADPDAIGDVLELPQRQPDEGFNEVFEQCPKREEGKECIYNWRTNFMTCLFCDRDTGLGE